MLASKALPHAGCLSQVGHQCHSREHRSEKIRKDEYYQPIHANFQIISAMAVAIQLKLNIRYVSLRRDNYGQRLIVYRFPHDSRPAPRIDPPLINYSIVLEHRQIISILICT